MKTKHCALVWLLALTLLIPGLAWAIKKGRLIGIVLDPDGKPIEGVTVTATSQDVVDFKVVEVTDRKGVFKIDFEEINVVYRYRFDKVGYQTTVTEQTWKKDGTARHKFVMQPGQAALGGDLAPASQLPSAVQAYNAGVAAFEAKELETAIARFREAVDQDPELRQGWAALSVAYLEARQHAAAAEAAEKAIALGATDLLVLKTRWEAYRNLGDEAKTAEAQAAVEKAGSLAEEAKRIFNEAVGFVKVDDDEAAFARFKQASELDPNLDQAVLGVATTGLKTGRYGEAMAAAEAILAEDPSNDQALRIRYNASLGLDDKDRIVDALVSLAPLEPETARTGLLQLALAAYDVNDMERAKDRFSKLLALAPDHPQGHYFLGLINVSEGANDAARRHFERFLELAPGDAEAGNVRDFLEHLSTP